MNSVVFSNRKCVNEIRTGWKFPNPIRMDRPRDKTGISIVAKGLLVNIKPYNMMVWLYSYPVMSVYTINCEHSLVY